MIARRATLAGLAAASALLVASCSEGAPEAGPGESAEPGAAAAFAAEAATLCTGIVNEAVAGPGLPSPNAVVADVLAAIAAGQEAPAGRRGEWATVLERHLARLEPTVERLAALAPPTADLAADWEAFLAAYDETAAVQRSRADALTSGSWVQVRAAFGTSSSSSDLAGVLEEMGLQASDCANVFSPDLVQPPETWRRFTAEAATICTEIVNRRLLGGYADDSELVRAAISEVAAGGEDSDTDAVDAALGRIAAEWRSTADDFAGVDAATSPAPRIWTALGELAAERVSEAEQQRAAIATSNDAAMAAAFVPPDYRYPGFGFELLLVEARSCGGLTA